MPSYLTKDSLTTSSRVIGYADDTTVYVKAKSLQILRPELERLGKIMMQYCNENGLITNSQKTQILTNAKHPIKVQIDQTTVSSNQTISLLGIEYDEVPSSAIPPFSLQAALNDRNGPSSGISYIFTDVGLPKSEDVSTTLLQSGSMTTLCIPLSCVNLSGSMMPFESEKARVFMLAPCIDLGWLS